MSRCSRCGVDDGEGHTPDCPKLTPAAGRMTPRQLVEALPPVVRVGGYDFKIETMSANTAMASQRWGECSTCEQTIRVQLDMPSPFKAVDTFLHEVTHAIFWVYGIDDADKEERTVGAVSSGLMALHRDNPWLLDWIRKALHP